METGHNKNVTNFETLIIACTGFEAPYKPNGSNCTKKLICDSRFAIRDYQRDPSKKKLKKQNIFLCHKK
jgi:hypothetical protein